MIVGGIIGLVRLGRRGGLRGHFLFGLGLRGGLRIAHDPTECHLRGTCASVFAVVEILQSTRHLAWRSRPFTRLISSRENACSERLVDSQPLALNGVRYAVTHERSLEEVMTSIEMASQKGQGRVRFGERPTLVALRAAEKAASQRDLLLDDVRLVPPVKQKPHNGVDEEVVVEGGKDRAYHELAPYRLVWASHPNETSTPAPSRTIRASVAKSSSPFPLSSSHRRVPSSHEKCQARALAANQI